MQIKQVISAQSTIVEFNGQEVGALQDLTIVSNYNLQEIDNLYQHTVQSYAQGIAKYQVSAKRAFLELNSIFGSSTSIFNVINDFQKAKELTETPNQSSIDQQLRKAAAIGKTLKSAWDLGKQFFDSDLDTILNKAEKLRNGEKVDINDLLSTIKFNIRVTNPIVNFPDTKGWFGSVGGGVISDITNKLTGNKDSMFILSGCKVNSKNIQISVGGVAIMENLTIYVKDYADFINLQK